jgi:citrate synthase
MPEYPTSIGTSDAESITLLGHDVASELMGKVSFGELAVFEAVLVALADHGFTPSAIAARLTLTGAPESLQGALAAGLLGGGSRYLGVTEDCGRFLADALALAATSGPLPSDDAGWDELARSAVTAQRAAGKFVPGLGHPIHKNGDPRTPVIFRIAGDAGLLGPHLRLFAAVGRVHPEILGRTLPLNGAGVCGAALADLGYPPDLLRGFALLARTAGLLGHLAEEMRTPVGQSIYRETDESVRYSSPATG